jgi:hypothetical protein
MPSLADQTNVWILYDNQIWNMYDHVQIVKGVFSTREAAINSPLNDWEPGAEGEYPGFSVESEEVRA